MVSQSSPSWKALALLLLMFIGGHAFGQWHVYCYRDTFQVPVGVSSVLDVTANDDWNAPSSAINYIPNPITVGYSSFIGFLVTEFGGTLVILNNDSIEYTPPQGFTGMDRFYYGVSDASAPTGVYDTAQAWVQVGTVTALADPLAQQLELYPNPTTDQVRVRSPHAVGRIEIYNWEGRLVAQGNQSVDVRQLAPGVYMARIQMADQLFTRKFLKD